MAAPKKVDKPSEEPKQTKKKLWRVIANNVDDSDNGVHKCCIQGKNYWAKLNSPIELPDPVLSYFQNAEILTVPGIDLTDDDSYIDIRKKNFETVKNKRFDVTEA